MGSPGGKIAFDNTDKVGEVPGFGQIRVQVKLTPVAGAAIFDAEQHPAEVAACRCLKPMRCIPSTRR